MLINKFRPNLALSSSDIFSFYFERAFVFLACVSRKGETRLEDICGCLKTSDCETKKDKTTWRLKQHVQQVQTDRSLIRFLSWQLVLFSLMKYSKLYVMSKI